MSGSGGNQRPGLADDQASGYVYEFGSWLIEPQLNRIRKPGEEHQLEPRTIEVLTYLLEHAGEIVSIDDLLDNVWADRIVEPNAVHRNLARIRRALGDPPRAPEYIETISKRGYRTIARVTRVEATDSDPALKAALEAVTPPYPAYAGDEEYVFVCYSHNDRETVYRELVRLREAGVNVWYDEGIPPGSEWEQEIAGAIGNCSHFLLFVSPLAVASKHCLDEIQYARNRGRQLVVVYIEPTTLPEGLQLAIGRIQALFKYMMREKEYARKLLLSLTSEATSRPADVMRIPHWRRSFRRLTPFLAALLIVAALLVLSRSDLVERLLRSAPDNSIAVGRFEDLSPTSDQQWIGGSIVSELTVLFPQHGLQVIGTPTSNVEAALARYQVSGSTMRMRDRLRVTARLVSMDTQHQIWADVVFEGRIDPAQDVQLNVAKVIARAVAGNILEPSGDATLVNATPNEKVGALQQLPSTTERFPSFPDIEETPDEQN